MSQTFEGYERQYCELSANLSKMSTSAVALDGEQKMLKLSEINSGVEDAETLIMKMDLVARSLPPNVKYRLLDKSREHKTDLKKFKSEVKRITSGNLNAAARDELREAGMADTMTASDGQRSRLMMSKDSLGRTTDIIKGCQKTMLETEKLGVSILQGLHGQRQSLLHNHDTILVVEENVEKCHKILTALMENWEKWAIVGGGIILFLLFNNKK